MLLGRDDERLALDRLLAEARGGRSGVLALVGEPGIGKTALLEYAAERAEGMRVLRARGVESEAEIPFAGLVELLRPALPALDRIPAPQSSALAGALALAPATAGDRFAIGAATLSLLSASAEDGPLLLLIDDAHWLDRSSAGALLFAARRLFADPIALVIAALEGEPSLLDGSDLRALRIAGLSRGDASQLLAGADAPPEVIEGLIRTTGGNPLAMLELAADPQQLPASPAAGPAPISASIATSFLGRFGRLPEPTRRILVVAATSDTGALAVLARAAAALDLDLDDLVAAEEAGLIDLDAGTIAFRHPLARAAMYADASARERRDAHAALAAALPDHEIDRRAWHLAAAAVGPDERAASALGQAGARAHARSAYAVAAAAFERAAALAPGDELRGRMLLEAAGSSWLAGDAPHALESLDQAEPYVSEPGLRARIDYLRGQVEMHQGPVMHGYALVVGAAERIAPDDPEAAVVMLAQAVYGSGYAGDTTAMGAAARQAVELADGDGSGRARFFASIAQGIALVADGNGKEGAAAIREAVEIIERSDQLQDDPELLVWAAVGPMWLRETEAGRAVSDRAFAQARAQVAVGILPSILHMLARDQATTDRWPAVEANYDEAIRLARETGQRVELAASLAGLTWLEARQGREEACREHAKEALALCDEHGVGFFGIWPIQALGDLELGLSHVEAAVEQLRAPGAGAGAPRHRRRRPLPRPGAGRGLRSTGPRERGSRAGGRVHGACRGEGTALGPGPGAALPRTDLRPDEIPGCFEEALELHELTPDGFEAARTRLAYGARLRRTRRRALAREQLRAALEAFEALGARPWADQADAELAATGETARRRDASTLDDLTPQELQIARLLADGKTTREAAAAVFVSPKTIEYHLRHVYSKLGIHSRAELTARFDGAA